MHLISYQFINDLIGKLSFCIDKLPSLDLSFASFISAISYQFINDLIGKLSFCIDKLPSRIYRLHPAFQPGVSFYIPAGQQERLESSGCVVLGEKVSK